MANFTAVFDACVLYPAPLRDLLIRATSTDLFRARWTSTIQDEWTRNVLQNNSHVTATQLQRTIELMNLAVPDSLITGYESIIDALILPDPDDRHVLAAAIRCQADVIVTQNLRDFPEEVLALYDIEAQHPDIFLQHLFDIRPPAFCAVVRDQRAALSHPPYSVDELLDTFLQLGLVQTVAKLKGVKDLI